MILFLILSIAFLIKCSFFCCNSGISAFTPDRFLRLRALHLEGLNRWKGLTAVLKYFFWSDGCFHNFSRLQNGKAYTKSEKLTILFCEGVTCCNEQG